MNKDEKELYDKLKDSFGITMVSPNIHLRYGEGKTAHLILIDIEDYNEVKTRCFSCESKNAKYKTKVRNLF